MYCPTNFEPFNGRCYWTDGASSNYNDAHSTCASRGGVVPTPKSDAENQDLVAYGISKGLARVWIGFDDIGQEGTYVIMRSRGKPRG